MYIWDSSFMCWGTWKLCWHCAGIDINSQLICMVAWLSAIKKHLTRNYQYILHARLILCVLNIQSFVEQVWSMKTWNTPLACFPFISPTVHHHVPSGFNWTLPTHGQKNAVHTSYNYFFQMHLNPSFYRYVFKIVSLASRLQSTFQNVYGNHKVTLDRT